MSGSEGPVHNTQGLDADAKYYIPNDAEENGKTHHVKGAYALNDKGEKTPVELYTSPQTKHTFTVENGKPTDHDVTEATRTQSSAFGDNRWHDHTGKEVASLDTNAQHRSDAAIATARQQNQEGHRPTDPAKAEQIALQAGQHQQDVQAFSKGVLDHSISPGDYSFRSLKEGHNVTFDASGKVAELDPDKAYKHAPINAEAATPLAEAAHRDGVAAQVNTAGKPADGKNYTVSHNNDDTRVADSSRANSQHGHRTAANDDHHHSGALNATQLHAAANALLHEGYGKGKDGKFNLNEAIKEEAQHNKVAAGGAHNMDHLKELAANFNRENPNKVTLESHHVEGTATAAKATPPVKTAGDMGISSK